MPQATRNPPPETWLETCLAGIGLVMIIAGLWLALLLIDAGRYEPEERCFDAATTESGYCRTQHNWQ